MKGKVLVVDDDVAIRTLIKTVLEEHGYSVIEANDGEDAIAVARNQGPNVILLDIMLPVMDGYTICKELKHSPITRHIPLIFVTVKDQVADRIEGFRLGADDYIHKPFSPLELVARVEAVLNRAFHLLDQLTGLPGRGVVEEEILRGLDGKRNFSIFSFRLEQGEKMTEVLGNQRAAEVLVLLANVLIKVLSREGDREDFLGIYDRYTDVAISFASKPEDLFEEILTIWKKLRPMEEKRLKAPDMLQLNAVHMRVENLNQNLDTIFGKMNRFFENGQKSGTFMSAGTL